MSGGHLGPLLPLRIVNKGPQNIRTSPGISYCRKSEGRGRQSRNLTCLWQTFHTAPTSGQTTLQERQAESDRLVNHEGPLPGWPCVAQHTLCPCLALSLMLGPAEGLGVLCASVLFSLWNTSWASEMAQQERTLPAKPENLSLNPSECWGFWAHK